MLALTDLTLAEATETMRTSTVNVLIIGTAKDTHGIIVGLASNLAEHVASQRHTAGQEALHLTNGTWIHATTTLGARGRIADIIIAPHDLDSHFAAALTATSTLAALVRY